MVMIGPQKSTITIQHEGKDYSGRYRFSKGLLTVRYKNECKNAFLQPDSDPELKARLMLIDIIRKIPKEHTPEALPLPREQIPPMLIIKPEQET